MKYTCKNCNKEVDERWRNYNRMAIQDEWCEECWYKEHWRSYTFVVGDKGFHVAGSGSIEPPDSYSFHYESYQVTDWDAKLTILGAQPKKWIPEVNEHDWLQEDPKEIFKRISKEYKTVVVAHGTGDESDKIFYVAVNGQLFVPAEEEKSE